MHPPEWCCVKRQNCIFFLLSFWVLNLNFLYRKQDLESQDRSGNEDSGDMSEEEEEEEVGDDCWSISIQKYH